MAIVNLWTKPPVCCVGSPARRRAPWGVNRRWRLRRQLRLYAKKSRKKSKIMLENLIIRFEKSNEAFGRWSVYDMTALQEPPSQ